MPNILHLRPARPSEESHSPPSSLQVGRGNNSQKNRKGSMRRKKKL